MHKAAFGACLMMMAGAPFAMAAAASAQARVVPGDHISTSQGDLVIHTMKHATLAMAWNGRTVFVDPIPGPQMRYQELPEADLILVTGLGPDHLDVKQLEGLVKKTTRIVVPVAVNQALPADLQAKAVVLAKGEASAAFGIKVDAVAGPAGPASAAPQGNSYVLTFGDKRVYLSGDLATPAELETLHDIDVAFVDFDQPPATTPEKTAAAVRKLHPTMLYPYDYHRGDPVEFKRLIGWDSDIEVRIRAWY